MKILLILIMVFGIVNADNIEVVMKATATKLNNTPIDNAYFHEDENAYVHVYVRGDYSFNDNLSVYGKIGNGYEDTLIEEAGVILATRHGNHIYEAKLGTINMVRGVFDPSLDADQQAPIIFTPSGVYDDRWKEGFFGSQLGVQLKYGYTFDYALVQVSYSRTDPRITNEKKAETSIFNYESEVIDVDYGIVDTLAIEVDIGSNVEIFGSVAKGTIDIKDVSGLTDSEKYMWYVTSPGTFDTGSAFVSDDFKYIVSRLGASYSGEKFTLAVEAFSIKTDNEEIDYHEKRTGGYVYGNVFLPWQITPYASYGMGEDNQKEKLEEYIIGVRKGFGHQVSLLVEYRKTDWAQIDTLQDYNDIRHAVKEEDIDMGVLAIQLIVRY